MVTDHFWPPPPFSLQMEMHGEAYSTVPSAVCQCGPSNYDRPVTPTAHGAPLRDLLVHKLLTAFITNRASLIRQPCHSIGCP
ncbi:hypothetical protein VFPBJ_11206 [Purpureocillium lilacinum]|uniref:Uncharacterized protein n=1 Tax=Purpureocillium lilacinum TaxID=33203 RepID=A0A179FJ13_PURLI|nr:hypothetical protein VFPBJ_11206 [Purpureocillium lilacinum]